MSNVLTFSRTTGSSERPAMNHTLASSKFTADKTINVTGNITSIVYKFIFKYTGSSNPSWTGYASIVASDGTIYKGTSLTKTITHDTNVSMSLTIPEANCPPPSVINSNNFKVKLTTTNCGKDPYVPASSKMSIVITYEDKKTQAYVWTTTLPLTCPAAAMTSDSSQGCVASASSIYSRSYHVYHAFDNSDSTAWCSSKTDTTPWIQLQMPEKLYNISITLKNRVHSSHNIGGFINGNIKGSNDGSSWTILHTFSERNGSTSGYSNTYTLNNSSNSYSYIRVTATSWDKTENTYASLNQITIKGFYNSSAGGWVEATPYIWTTTQRTVELPEQAMTSNESQGCIASSSSIYNNEQQAFRAFNKSIASSDRCWASSYYDTAPWIQITLPQKLYNIELEIHNRHDYNNETGITDAIIYGSNDGGSTLTQIGTITGRSAAFKAMSVETCNNADIGYSTIKLDITGHGGTNAVTVGEIYIRGIVEDYSWVPVSPYIYRNGYK